MEDTKRITHPSQSLTPNLNNFRRQSTGYGSAGRFSVMAEFFGRLNLEPGM
jgi:hypothetical protein